MPGGTDDDHDEDRSRKGWRRINHEKEKRGVKNKDRDLRGSYGGKATKPDLAGLFLIVMGLK